MTWKSPAQNAMELKVHGWSFFPATKRYNKFWLHSSGERAMNMDQAWQFTWKWTEERKKVHGTITGRFSSAIPNVEEKDKLGMTSADWSQWEKDKGLS